MNMSFGVHTAPPAAGDVGGIDAPPAPSTPGVASTPLPPVPAAFSASFTYQGPSGNVAPPSRPPTGFQYAGAPPRFSYPSAPATVPPSPVPPPASQVPPYPAQPGFTFQGTAGNSAGMASSQTGAVGPGPPVNVRPFPPTGMAASVSAAPQVVAPPLQLASSQGSQAVLQGSAMTPDATPALQPVTGVSTDATPATPPGSLPVPGTQARPSTATPPITGLQGQIQMPPAVSPVGGLTPARTGVALSSAPALSYTSPRVGFNPAPVVGGAVVPPGDMRISFCYFTRAEESLV